MAAPRQDMASSSAAPPAVTDADDSETQQPLTTSLTNIRRLSSSSLAHQAKPAQVLIAIESTLAAELPEGAEHSPTAYFVAILSCLSKAVFVPAGSKAKTDIAETGGLTPAILYLLATVLPYTPRPILLSHLSTLLPLLTNLFPIAQQYAPPLRSLLQITATILTSAPPPSTLSSPLLKKIWNHVLTFLLDARPKIRHLAHETVRRTLMMPTPPRGDTRWSSLHHPINRMGTRCTPGGGQRWQWWCEEGKVCSWNRWNGRR